MGQTINNILIGTANIADSAVTQAKLASTMAATESCWLTNTDFTDVSGVYVDILGATKTWLAGELAVGDVIEVSCGVDGGHASGHYASVAISGLAAGDTTTRVYYNSASTDGAGKLWITISSTTRANFIGFRQVGATLTEGPPPGLGQTITDISANAITLKLQWKATNALNVVKWTKCIRHPKR